MNMEVLILTCLSESSLSFLQTKLISILGPSFVSLDFKGNAPLTKHHGVQLCLFTCPFPSGNLASRMEKKIEGINIEVTL